jgi:tetratricopeptide (TPR) repeat protein
LLPAEKRNEGEALKYFELANKIRPNAPSTARMLGNFYRYKNDLDKALSEYQKTVELITDSSSFALSSAYNVLGHVYLLKGDYIKAREFYGKYLKIGGLDTSKIFYPTVIPVSYLYEKKYEEVIQESMKGINEIEKKKESINKNNTLYGLQNIIYVAYSHSLKEEEALASLEKLNSYRQKNKAINLANLVDQKQLENIEIGDKIFALNLSINHNILFAHYEEAEEQLIELEAQSKKILTQNPFAMNGFYKFSGHLNLMKGNIKESIDFFKKYTGLDQDKYYYYFYGLALKAQGDKVESDKIFTLIADESFVGWSQAIVRDLAKAQVNAGN